VRRCEALVFVLGLAACSGKREGAKHEPALVALGSGSAGSAVPAAAEGSGSCSELPFAASTPVPEASGAAWLELGGKPALLVVSDSGNKGAYAIIDAETGDTKEQGSLPLGKGASEDVEGLASRGDTFYGVTSSGWIREWKRDGAGFRLANDPYPLGPIDLPPKSASGGNKPPEGDGMVCEGTSTNCGRNYEGLCLAPLDPSSAINPNVCIGFAASKADGHLYCVTQGEDGKLAVHHGRSIAIDKPGVVADCAFSADRNLVVGNNLFGLSKVFHVADWVDPANAKVSEIGMFGPGFPETIAANGDLIYRLSDTGGTPSLMAKFRCPAIER
jgi:hypothetical protein